MTKAERKRIERLVKEEAMAKVRRETRPSWPEMEERLHNPSSDPNYATKNCRGWLRPKGK